MSEHLQVSNARRVAFTALALVVFWGAAWTCYAIGFDQTQDFLPELGSVFACPRWVFACPCWALAVSLASSPIMLLSFSVCESFVRLRDVWFFFSNVLFVGCMLWGYSLGERDVNDSWGAWFDAVGIVLSNGPSRDELHEYHEVSWLSILLPLILTTAFVIYGAWRSAVGSAATEVDDE